MSQFQKGLFDKLQENANINPDDVHKVADSVKHMDFSDEKMVRKLVQHLARMTNRRVSKEKEDKIVESITKNDVPMDIQSLTRLFKN